MVAYKKGHGEWLMDTQAIEQQILNGAWRFPNYAVYQVGGAAGGECYLIVSDSGSAALIDAGYAWDAPATLANIRRVLTDVGASHLEWLLLTHSHYDHAAGAGYLARYMPGLKVACSAYAARVFSRPGALATMRTLNASEAHLHGLTDFEEVPASLTIDRVLEPGDTVRAADMDFTVLAAPGHTKCSIAFWCADRRFLVSCETGCVYAGPLDAAFRDVLGNPAPQGLEVMADPAYLVGYASSLDFIAREIDLHPDVLLVPHFGIMTGDAATSFLHTADYFSRYAADLIMQAHTAGASNDEVIARFKAVFYNDYVQAIQPEAAFDLNASYLVPLVIRELSDAQ